MRKSYKKITEEILEEYFDTLYPNTANDFAEIVAYLLSRFFKGEFTVDGETIICSLKSGQKFIVNTERIK